MNEKQMEKLLHETKAGLRIENVAKLLYLLKAWKVLSDNNSIDKLDITFEEYCNQKIDAKSLQSTIERIAKTIKIFELFLKQSINISKFKDDSIVKLFTIVKEENLLQYILLSINFYLLV